MSLIQCFDPVPTRAYANIFAAAADRAKKFDRIIITPETEGELLAIGDAVGGISQGGFLHDLIAAQSAARRAVLDANPDDCHDIGFLSPLVERDIDAAVRKAVGQWLDATQPWSDYDAAQIEVPDEPEEPEDDWF